MKTKTNLVYETMPNVQRKKIDIRERIVKYGTDSVSDYELIAAILGSGVQGKNVKVLSAEIVSKCNFSSAVPKVEDLVKIQGLGNARACRLSAALELGRRFYGTKGKYIRSPDDVWKHVQHFDDGKQERFLCCTLNGAHALIAVHVVTVGLLDRAIIHPREVFSAAIADRAAAIIVAHNHPSGRLEASAEDREITNRLKKAGTILGIDLLDHIIFSKDGCISLAEQGLLTFDD